MKPPEDTSASGDLSRLFTFGAWLAYTFIIVIWVWPTSFAKLEVLRGLPWLRGVGLVAKLDQDWGMFAPDPPTANRRVVVRALLGDQTTREEDLTRHANQTMRSFSMARVGKLLKVHDRVLGGDNAAILTAFAHHTCHELGERWHQRVLRVEIDRVFENLTIDPVTMVGVRGATFHQSMGTYGCPSD